MIRLDGLQHWQVPSARGVPSRGPPAKLLADQPLAQLPQGHGRQLIASLGRGQAAAAVVEVHPSQPLQLGGRRAVHGRGGSLLLKWHTHTENKKKLKKTLYIYIYTHTLYVYLYREKYRYFYRCQFACSPSELYVFRRASVKHCNWSIAKDAASLPAGHLPATHSNEELFFLFICS